MNSTDTMRLIDRSFIIPAIDIIDGKCVRLSKGNFDTKKIYHENPLDIALQLQNIGCTRLHVVDLDGARSGKVVNWKTLEELSTNTNFIIDFGGGIKSDEDIERVFDCGASIAVVGSIAVTHQELFEKWLNNYGGEKILLGSDVRGMTVAINGWKDDSVLSITELLTRYSLIGLNQYFCTDIDKDGMMKGPSIKLYRDLLNAFPLLDLIASGGVRSVEDILTLNRMGCKGAIVGKALYEGLITTEDIKNLTGYAG